MSMVQEYTIIRSPRRRKLTISVERDRTVVVHAPEDTSEAQIHEVLEEKRQWIVEKMNHIQKYDALPHPPGKEMVNGESALYLGYEYCIEVVDDGRKGIELSQTFLLPAGTTRFKQEAFREWYIKRAKQEILPRVKTYAHKLGVEYTSAKIVDNRYRWGSCTSNNVITINWRLIKAPISVIDYVIVHELAHLIEGNHTPQFWNIIKAQLADFEKSKQWLREHGQLLEYAI